MNVKDIKDDKFLRELNNKQLNEVAKDIRDFIVDNVSKTGGHLSSNLGSVELIMSLHKEFDLDKDKLLFDVGHQAYTHKILTGRAEKFDTLRKMDGLSGFLSSDESKYDVFESGHSSTSISTAMGMALARDVQKQKYEIISFIGDGSIANGIAFEALNNIESQKSKVIIVLNDNDMAINKSVGAIARALSRVRTSRSYALAKKGFSKIFNAIPYIGPKFVNFTRRMMHRLVLIFRSDNVFDNFNISYLGPIDGHDFKALSKAFKKAKKYPSSILIHVKTKKGFGYKLTEEDELGKFHGVEPFDKVTGKIITVKNPDLHCFSEVYSSYLYDMMKEDNKMFLISAAMINGAKLEKCFTDFPSRCIDVGIAEEHAIAFANGLALNNMHPYVSMYSTFMQRGYDEIVHDVCRVNADVTFLVDRAGIVGEDGKTHQGMFDVSFVYPLENSIITIPSSYKYVKATLDCLKNTHAPKFIRIPKALVRVEKEVEKVEFGKMICDNYSINNKVSLIAVGNVFDVLEKQIKEQNLPINLINPLFIKPLDENMLDKIKDSTVVIYDNTSVFDGFASNICKYFLKYDTKVISYTLPNKYIKHGEYDEVLKYLNLSSDYILNKVKELL